ncbi:hypothetical protein M153_3020001890 [Pseudoloma neurophilia]|uniref:Uncharacterized protein n=1 Tax=Pseudoloma neurophilia TaxID=146866 RepID=A0A0R0LYF1_9MICR|nr:hypothetical protein M153_3020001890 [Pseudoloma neurophilia]
MFILLFLQLFIKFNRCSDESDNGKKKSQGRQENPPNIILGIEKSDQDLKDRNIQTKIKIFDLTIGSQQQKTANFPIHVIQKQQKLVNPPKNENNEPLNLSLPHKTENEHHIIYRPHFFDEQKTKCLNLQADSNPIRYTETSLTTSKLFTRSVIEGKMDDIQPSTSSAFESRAPKRHISCTNEPLVSEKRKKISERTIEEPASLINTKIFEIEPSKILAITGCKKRKQKKPKKFSKTQSKDYESLEKMSGCKIKDSIESNDEEVKTKNTLKFVETKGPVVRTSSDLLTLQFISEQFSELKKSSKLTAESFTNQFIDYVERINPKKKICFPFVQRCDVYFDSNANTNIILSEELRTKVQIDNIEKESQKDGKIIVLGKRVFSKCSRYRECFFFIPKMVGLYHQFNSFDNSEDNIFSDQADQHYLVAFTFRISKPEDVRKEYSSSVDAQNVSEQFYTCSLVLIHKIETCPLKKYALVFHHGQAVLLKQFKLRNNETSYTIHIPTEEDLKLLRD